MLTTRILERAIKDGEWYSPNVYVELHDAQGLRIGLYESTGIYPSAKGGADAIIIAKEPNLLNDGEGQDHSRQECQEWPRGMHRSQQSRTESKPRGRFWKCIHNLLL